MYMYITLVSCIIPKYNTGCFPVVEDKSLKRWSCTTSSANYESSPGQILSSLQTMLSASLPGSEAGSPPGVISCP